MENYSIKIGTVTHEVSPHLFGLFLEDINFACDGGLNANMVINHSFDGCYMTNDYDFMADAIFRKIPPTVYEDRLRYWWITGGKLESQSSSPASEKNPWYAHVTVNAHAVLQNKGYNGGQKYAGCCAMNIQKDHTYRFSGYMRNTGYEGSVTVSVRDNNGRIVSDEQEIMLTDTWKKTETILTAEDSVYGMLQLEFRGKGTIDLDCVTLEDTDVWGAGNEKWSGGHFRKDLVEALQELQPTFLRFPGGCIVEGIYPGNEYKWKDTVGPIIDRVPEVSLWEANMQEKGYSQSNQIGFYEYFLLCEDLKMEPLPVVWAGLTCQFRSNEVLSVEQEGFEERVLRSALDLIEYANGNPADSYWANVRAEAGHPLPFGMKMIGIGNENFGSEYHKSFEKVKATINEKYPDIICVMSSGGAPSGADFDETWQVAKEKYPDVLIDEHFYMGNEWVYSQVNRYDEYPRNTAKVFLGEYAANDLTVPHIPNTFGSALAEAAFLTGVERNSDVVVMTSYAPLFCMTENGQWGHNMIYFNAKTVMKTPNYYVQQMYGQNQGIRTLEILSNLPERIYVSAVENETKVIVKIVNAGDMETVDIHVPNVPDGEVEVTVLQNSDLDAVNLLGFFGDVAYTVQPQSRNAAAENGHCLVKLEPQSFYVTVFTK